MLQYICTEKRLKKPVSGEPVVLVASNQNSSIHKVYGTVDVISNGFALVTGDISEAEALGFKP